MLTKGLKKVGNSQAIFLDKTLLGLVGATSRISWYREKARN